MAGGKNLRDEQLKYYLQALQTIFENSGGDLAVRTSSVGTIQIQGAQTVLATEELAVNATSWTEVILEKTVRNAINIQNRNKINDNGIEDIYISGLNTDTSSPTPEGMKIPRGGERQYAISDVPVYVKSKTQDVTITIEALG